MSRTPIRLFLIFSFSCLSLASLVQGQSMKVGISSIFGGNKFCSGTTGYFLLDANVSGGVEPYSYEWTFSWNDDTIRFVSPDVNPVVAETVTGGVVTLRVKDSHEFQKTATATFTIEEVLVETDFSFNPDNVCAETPIQFSPDVSGGDPDYTYSWYFGDGNQSTEKKPVHEYISTGCIGTSTFDATLRVSDANGCYDMATKTVRVINKPNLDFADVENITPFKHCHTAGASPVFDVTLENNSSDKSCIDAYTIDWGDGTTIDNNAEFPITHTYTEAGAFEIVITTENELTCKLNWSTMVYNQSIPNVNVTNLSVTEGCAPQPLEFILSNFESNSKGTTYTWDFKDGSPLEVWNFDDPYENDIMTHIYSRSSCADGLGMDSVVVTAYNGCGSRNSMVDGIYIWSRPVAAIDDGNLNIDSICTGEEIQLINASINGYYGATCDPRSEFFWDFGNLVTSDNWQMPPTSWDTPGEYDIILSAANDCGTSPDTFSIVVLEPPKAAVTVDATEGCVPFIPKFSNASTGGSISYLWKIQPASGYSFLSDTDMGSPEPVIRFDSASSYDVMFYVYNACDQRDSVSFHFDVYAAPEGEITGVEDLCITNPVLTPGVDYDENGSPLSDLLWRFIGGDPATSNVVNPGDVEYTSAGDYEVEVSLTNHCGTTVLDETFSLHEAPEIIVSSPVEICSANDLQIKGTIINHSTSYRWDTEGDGNFYSPLEQNPTYYPGFQDQLNGAVLLHITVNGSAPCAPVTGDVLVDIQQVPEVFAGPDVSVCEGSSYDIIDAQADFYGIIQWNSSGDGRFSDTRALQPKYTPGPTDLLLGSVELTLTATSIAPCTRNYTDAFTISYDRKPTIDAGPDKEICLDGSLTVSATGSEYSGVYWYVENGEGTFDDPNEESTVFRLSSGYAEDTVAVYIEAFGALNCPNSRDMLVLDVVQPPIAEAGIDGTICANQTYRMKGASVNEAASFYWIVNGDGTLDSYDVLDPVYSPGAGDISGGSAVLTLVAEGNGPCTSDSDDVIVTIQPLPGADAGDDQDVCLDHPVPLAGNQLHGNSWLWSALSLNPGTFDDPTSLLTTYHPSADDYANGAIKLVLTVAPQSPCNLPGSDTTFITFVDPPVVNAGPDTTICSSLFFTPDEATVQNSNAYYWESTGSGVFENGNSLTPTYLHSPADVAKDSIQLILISGSPTCPEVRDNLVLKITPYPVSYAGEDKVICVDQHARLDDATADHDGSLLWMTAGDGYFDQEDILHPVYTPGLLDIAAGNVKLYMEVNGQYPCDIPVKDSILLTIQKLPQVTAGDDTVIAQGQPFTIVDAGEVHTAGIRWESTGDGYFPDPFQVNATYIHGPDDLSNKWVDLVITGTPNAPCAGEVSDIMRLYITPRPDISAGEDQIICEGSDATITTAFAHEVSEIWWTFEGTGQIIDDRTLTPTYIPGAQDIEDREVILSLHARGEHPLEDLEVVDQMVITIYHNASVDVTMLDTACENQLYPVSDVSYMDVNGISWSSSGTGGFSQTTVPNPSYLLSPADRLEDTLYLSVEVTSHAPCGYTDRGTMMLRIFHEPNASFQVDDAEGCSPHSTLLANTSTGEDLSFNWNFGNGQESTLKDPGSITYQQGHIADTTYSILLEASNRCTTSSVRDEVVVKPVPIPGFGMDVAWGCSPKEIQFYNVSTGLADYYTWKWGDGSMNSIAEQPASHIFTTGERDTAYTITLVAENECGIDSVQKSVKIFPSKVTAFFETDTTLGCAPLEVNFTNYSRGVLGDEPFLNWSWNFGDGEVTDSRHPVHVFKKPGTYTVKLVVSDTCSVDYFSTEIEVLRSPEVKFETDRNAYCENDTVYFSPVDMPLDQIAAVTWDFGDRNTGVDFHESHVYENYGNYTVTLTAKDIVNGCTSSDSKSVTIYQSPVADFSIPENDACQPLNITFTNETEGADYYSWDFGNGNGSIDVHGSQVFTDSGVYTVSLYALDTEGCTDLVEKSVRVNPKPMAAFEPSSTQTCFPPVDVSFNNLSEGADDYLWRLGNGETVRITEPVTTYTGYGDYPVQLIVSNLYHCSDTSEMIYHVFHNPEADFEVGATVGCDPFSVLFTNRSYYGLEYQWRFGEHGFSSEEDPVYTFEGEGVSTVSLLVIGNGGCRDSITREDFIRTNPSPYAGFDYSRINEIDTVQFHNYSNGATSYLWDFGDGEFSEETDPWHRFLNYGIYDVMLTATNEYECTDSVVESINFELFKGLYLPNAFSPETRMEDVQEFRAVGIGLVKYHLLLYDTWGNLLWETTKLDRGAPAESWDGTFRGKPLLPDVYVWHLKEAIFKDGSAYEGERYGTVTLIR